jgi:antitoxin (DNA-binding transcriptional repressor) of toxin-antitoxin stability system
MSRRARRGGAHPPITKRGRPVAELIPHATKKRELWGILKDELFIEGDIVSPIDNVPRFSLQASMSCPSTGRFASLRANSRIFMPIPLIDS